ncbi:MAG TPA: hypothetical protein PLO19_06550 [Candidatus Cryosericum sp.]|nr:hypothetical protein [Candidatus Cryosericum sp.]
MGAEPFLVDEVKVQRLHLIPEPEVLAAGSLKVRDPLAAMLGPERPDIELLSFAVQEVSEEQTGRRERTAGAVLLRPAQRALQRPVSAHGRSHDGGVGPQEEATCRVFVTPERLIDTRHRPPQ